MSHSSENCAASIVSQLRNIVPPHAPTNDGHLVSGAYFSWDDTDGDVVLKLHEAPGSLFSLEGKVKKAPGWFSFNLSLGTDSFAPGDVMCVIAVFNATAGESYPFFIRTSYDDTELCDTPLQEGLNGVDAQAVQTVMHTFEPYDAATRGPGFHTLIMQLPDHNFSFEMMDLRVLILPADHGMRSIPTGLASAGA
ncbi:MAG: hypothetical protein AAFQ19_10040 [Pseudomonadota bacterium]